MQESYTDSAILELYKLMNLDFKYVNMTVKINKIKANQCSALTF